MDRIGSRKPVKWYLREWRKHLHLTQGQVAERVETAVAVVSQLETGQRQMNDKWISAFSDAFSIDPVDLLRDPTAPTIADLLRQASPDDQARIIDFARRLTRVA